MQSTKPPRADRLAWAAAFDISPLSAREYTERAGCSVATLYYWRKQLDISQDPEPAASFTAIRIAPGSAESVHLRLPGGIEVHGEPTALVRFIHQFTEHA